MIALTGATGFLGAALAQRLDEQDLLVVERKKSNFTHSARFDLAANADMPCVLLKDVNVLVHCAARVHVMNESEEGALDRFRKINVEGTKRLARAAAAAGVQRFIFISSIKVNGEGSCRMLPYRASDVAAPHDPYGQSKAEAEEELKAISSKTGMEVVIIRPPLIYGPGVKANFEKLLRWVSKGIPLPLGALKNKRSMVGLDNLVDLILTCIYHPKAANETFLVSDNDDVSTTELVRRLANSFNTKPKLISVPPAFLELAGALAGKGEVIKRLCGSLQVDICHTMETLNWQPPYTMQEQLDKTVKDYKRRNR